ncbi:MAG: HGxxPAAW family protein [Nocardioidaceae bacterium]|nr:HGxxPAAW family protein [Nocardioidaceae bacterium]
MHGSSPAAWTGVVVALVGFTVGGIGLVAGPSWPAFWVGLALAALAAPLAKGMAMAGYGNDHVPTAHTGEATTPDRQVP